MVKQILKVPYEKRIEIMENKCPESAESYNERQILSTAMNEYPLILLLQMADLAATYFDKK